MLLLGSVGTFLLFLSPTQPLSGLVSWRDGLPLALFHSTPNPLCSQPTAAVLKWAYAVANADYRVPWPSAVGQSWYGPSQREPRPAGLLYPGRGVPVPGDAMGRYDCHCSPQTDSNGNISQVAKNVAHLYIGSILTCLNCYSLLHFYLHFIFILTMCLFNIVKLIIPHNKRYFF